MSIPEELSCRVMYDSGWKCVVCTDRKAMQIHHIDMDKNNNTYDNLVYLCGTHHIEAHSTSTMARVLTAERLIDARDRHNSEIKAGRASEIPLNKFRGGINWGYINHSRVIQCLRSIVLDPKTTTKLNQMKSRGLVDETGIIDLPSREVLSANYTGNAYYDYYADGDDHRVHNLYECFLDNIVQQVDIFQFEGRWWQDELQLQMLKSGVFVFLRESTSFKGIEKTQKNEHRRARIRKENLELEYFVDTQDMFGTTSMTTSFRGNSHVSALILVKSIESQDGKIKVECTPIALGVKYA